MTSMTSPKRVARLALIVLGSAVVSCSNPPGRFPDSTGERTANAGPSAYQAELALDDIARFVEPRSAADDPARDLPAPVPRDWLKNLVGRGGKADPGAPSP